MVVRPFEENDRPALQEIYLASRTFAFYWLDKSTFQLADFDDATKDELILVAEVNSHIVGFASLWLPDNFIHHLFVHPGCLAQGIGKKLLLASIQALRQPVTLKCLINNQRAVQFYLAHNFAIKHNGNSNDGEFYLMEYMG